MDSYHPLIIPPHRWINRGSQKQEFVWQEQDLNLGPQGAPTLSIIVSHSALHLSPLPSAWPWYLNEPFVLGGTQNS